MDKTVEPSGQSLVEFDTGWQPDVEVPGLGPLILSIIITGIIGAYVASRQGGSTWRRAQERMASGQLPGKELAHGVMILVGGVLLLTPGFITDIAGFLLMVPAVREGVRRFAASRMMGKFAVIDIEGR